MERQEKQQQEANALDRRIKQQNELVKKLFGEYKEAKQELENMTKERDELAEQKTKLQEEWEAEKQKQEEGHNKVDNSLASASKSMDELEANILEMSKFWKTK